MVSWYRKRLGREGEDEAARLLERSGCRVVERNYRGRFGEIDLVADDGDTVVFVEVKTRTSHAFGSPAESVDAGKQRRIIKASFEYMQERGLDGRPVRYDVVTVEVRDGRARAEHIRDAFEAVE